jgi:putative addiction module component (TIGR02574 family)
MNMSKTSKTVLKAALALPPRDQAKIAEKLLESLRLTTDALDDDALLTELERRRKEYERDPSVAEPWSKIKNMR